MWTAATGLLLVVTLGTQQAPPAAAKADPRENLSTAIAESIRLLERKEYLQLLSMFVHPERLPPREVLEKLAVDFAKENADVMLIAMRKMQKTKPVMSADGTLATYAVTVPGTPASKMRWIKVGKFWYWDE